MYLATLMPIYAIALCGSVNSCCLRLVIVSSVYYIVYGNRDFVCEAKW